MNASPERPPRGRPSVEFRLRYDDTWAVVSVVGPLAADRVAELKHQLDHALTQRLDVILDLSQAASVDASGVELIRDMKRLVEVFGGRLRIVATSRTPELLTETSATVSKPEIAPIG